MKSAETKAKRNRDNFWNTVSIPYEDRELALWMKIIFGFIWAISILNGVLYGAPVSYLLAMGMMVALLAGNIAVCRRHYRRWIDVVTFTLLSIPIFYVYYHASIGYFSVLFPMLFSCGIVFILGIRNSFVINLFYLAAVILCFRFDLSASAESIYGKNVALRFPYLYICFVLIAYMLMYSIQRYWVEKRRRQEKLEQRVHEEKKKLQGMSMRVMNAMCRALGAKIPGEEEHCRQVAEYAKEIAERLELPEEMASAAYQAGLLHEIGMIGIPDELIQRRNLTDEEYGVFQTYVKMGYDMISELQVADTIAEAVYYHRENYDGSGYLAGKRGSEIPVLAQILAVADYADRHLRWGESTEMVRGKIKERENTRFEPHCAAMMEQILKERNED